MKKSNSTGRGEDAGIEDIGEKGNV